MHEHADEPARERARHRGAGAGPVDHPDSLALGDVAGLGATTFLEVGHGSMLAGLAKRTTPDVPVRGVATPEDADALTLEEVR